MTNQYINGIVDLSMKILKKTNKVILDYQGLDIHNVQLVHKNNEVEELKFKESTPKENLGSKL